MSEEAQVPVVSQEDEKSSEMKMSGSLEPSIADIVANPDEFTFNINEFVIAPRVEVLKNSKVVKVIDNINQQKYAGNINEEYAENFLSDLVNDFRIGLAEAYFKNQRQMLAMAKRQASQNQG